MKKLRFTLVLATILFAAACHNPNSSTAQEVDDETPAKTEEHGGSHSTTDEHKATGANEHKTEAKDTTVHMDTTITGDTTSSRPH